MKRVLIATIIIAVLGTLVLSPLAVFAENSEIPQPMVGQLKYKYNSDPLYSWGGFTANETMYNNDINAVGGSPLDLFGYNQSTLDACRTTGIAASPAYCFQHNRSLIVAKSMVSRTFIYGTPSVDVAALFYNGSIIGDVSAPGNDLNNFSLYGRNLYRNSSSINSSSNLAQSASWLGQGALNAISQSSYSTEQQRIIDTRIATLKGEASEDVSMQVGTAGTWYLQSTSTNDLQTSGLDKDKWPEGRVWAHTGTTTTISADHTYSGLGTLIIDGNLVFGTGVDLTPADTTSKMGIIVKGDVTLRGNNNINAAILATGTVTIQNSNKMVGSFVANNFSFGSTSQTISYDYRLEAGWPPGFRYFQMPSPQGASPN